MTGLTNPYLGQLSGLDSYSAFQEQRRMQEEIMRLYNHERSAQIAAGAADTKPARNPVLLLLA